ncbi:MAG: T9SS type A sorting domain-containing protein, partial [Ignavibacteriales bacterium]|nr:T9SS type A sorting domain-containing protein [Ignavibacteriales bacterium]
HSLTYPVTVTAQGADIVLRDKATSGKLVNKVIRAGEAYVISNNGIEAVVLGLFEKPMAYELSQNYPNPFNPSTTIKFGVPEKAEVSIVVFNHLGQKVADVMHEEKEAGYYTVNWNATNYASGVYYYKLTAGKFNAVKKLILMK